MTRRAESATVLKTEQATSDERLCRRVDPEHRKRLPVCTAASRHCEGVHSATERIAAASASWDPAGTT